MLKAAVPRPTATSTRAALPPLTKAAQDMANEGRGSSWRVAAGLRASCFHKAITFSTTVTTAAAWITWMSCTWLKSWSR
jgi:hypothetical protein